MGTKIAIAFANVFMADIETHIISKSVIKSMIWKRYNDGLFSLWVNSQADIAKLITQSNNEIYVWDLKHWSHISRHCCIKRQTFSKSIHSGYKNTLRANWNLSVTHFSSSHPSGVQLPAVAWNKEGDMGGPWTPHQRKKKKKNTGSPNHTRNHSTANNFISPNTAAWKTQTSHTVIFEITATPQIENLFNASPHQKNINATNPHVPLNKVLLSRVFSLQFERGISTKRRPDRIYCFSADQRLSASFNSS